MDKRVDRFSRLDAIPWVRRRHYSKHRATQSVVRVINETLNISNKAFRLKQFTGSSSSSSSSSRIFI